VATGLSAGEGGYAFQGATRGTFWDMSSSGPPGLTTSGRCRMRFIRQTGFWRQSLIRPETVLKHDF